MIVSYVPIDGCGFCVGLLSGFPLKPLIVLICNYEKQINMVLAWLWLGEGWTGE